ncbi:T9SS type A sorting domain-containing protein [bacterium]|nr:T9SS type A sorting domain-containing protein [bacterium]
MKIRFAIFMLILLVSSSLLIAQVREYPHVMDNGGGRIAGGGYNNLASIGQAVSSTVTGGGYTNRAGYITAIYGATVGIVEEPLFDKKPGTFALDQNFPNPFNATTRIKFQIPEDTDVEFAVFNVLGEKIVEIKERKAKGAYSINFETDDMPTGVYLYVLKAGNYQDCKRMMILK